MFVYLHINKTTGEPPEQRAEKMKITKKSIELAVRQNDVTTLFRLFKGDREKVHEAVSNLTINKLAKRAYDLAYGQMRSKKYRASKQIHSKQIAAILHAKNQVNSGSIKTNYAKILIEGNSNIYWAHPYYGHSDYNKSVAFDNTESNRLLAAKINSYLKKHR